MTSIIKLETISGAYDDGPLCYLLQVDQASILLDCGWDETFNMEYIESIKRRIPQINAVLLSHSNISHLGALPYLFGKCGLNCPVYATVPVYKMGQLFLQDWLMGHKSVEEFDLFDVSDIEKAFEMIEYVKFGQVINLKGDSGLQVMPVVAGHTLGGALWRITKMGDEVIIYATDFNLRRERHLNACSFDVVGRPNVLITDAFGTPQLVKLRARDEALMSKLLSTLREGGDVMIVIDTAGRVLELAYMLDQLWQNRESGLTIYSLVLLNYVASAVVESTKSMLEYMSDKLLAQCEAGKPNPFQFSYLRCCHSIEELNNIRSPKVVLTSGLDMETGFSRELFLNWSTDHKNIIIITGRSHGSTLGSKLIQIAEAREQRRAVSDVVDLTVKRRIKLDGAELEAYKIRKREQEELEAKLRLENVRRNIRIEQQAESSDESDDEYAPLNRSDMNPKTNGNEVEMKPEANFGYDLMSRFEHNQKTSFFKRNRKQFPMFPHIEEKTRWDDYGQIIHPEDYTLTESNSIQQSLFFKHQNQRKSEIKEEDESDSESEAEMMEICPTKCISYPAKIEVFSKLAYIDLEGRTDLESTKKLISQIRPKQIVLVHGSEQSTEVLAEHYRQSGDVDKVFTPKPGDSVDLTIESHIYQVILSDPLMSSLAFQPARDSELCWVDARLKRRKMQNATDFSGLGSAQDQSEDIELVDPHEQNGNLTNEESMELDDDAARNSTRADGNAQTDQLYLEILPSNNIPSHEAVFVNDPKLSDMRIFLEKSGFTAEFSAGILYVNESLRISRNDAGRFEIEGPASEEFYRIRDSLYSQFAIV